MSHEPLIDGITIDVVLDRLRRLEAVLDREGMYTQSNTVWLAQEAISELRYAHEVAIQKEAMK